MQEYYSVAREAETELIIQKSRFITRVVPVASEEEARQKLDEIRFNHREANHNVYAYRLGRIERFSDDGEPSGTAGRPVLEVLRREEVDNVLVVVTRYFGGILLGAGGLVRAYAQGAKSGLDEAGRIRLSPYRKVIIDMEYGWANRIQYEAEIRGYFKEVIRYTERVEAVFLIPESEAVTFKDFVVDLSGGVLNPVLGEVSYRPEPLAGG